MFLLIKVIVMINDGCSSFPISEHVLSVHISQHGMYIISTLVYDPAVLLKSFAGSLFY